MSSDQITAIGGVITVLTGLVIALTALWREVKSQKQQIVANRAAIVENKVAIDENTAVTNETHRLVNSNHDDAVTFNATLIERLNDRGIPIPADPGVASAKYRVEQERQIREGDNGRPAV